MPTDHMSKEIPKLVEKVIRDQDALAALTFGSYARNEKYTDIDICIMLKPKKLERLSLSKKRLEYLSAFPSIDIHIYQQLPLYIRTRILREGRILHCKNEDVMYDLAVTTVREHEYFKPIYNSYLKGVLYAR